MSKFKTQYEALYAMFPGGPCYSPETLADKLKNLEREANQCATAHCNGEIGDKTWEKQSCKVLSEVEELLPGITNPFNDQGCYLFVNGDPRGFTLKLAVCRNSESKRLPSDFPLETDWGGFGILAPDRD